MVTAAKIWILLLSVYTAPLDAVDWQGDWKLGPINALEHQFSSKEECTKAGQSLKAQLQEEIRAPMRMLCIPLWSGLPAGSEM